MANSLKNPENYQSITDRFHHLSENNSGQWGKMNVCQMLDHLAKSFDAANGDLIVPPEPLSFLLSITVLKKIVIQSMPWPKNLMTAKSYISTDSQTFTKSKKRLFESIEKFVSLDHYGAHPLFGKMEAELWGQLQYKHCHHHLTQFGA